MLLEGWINLDKLAGISSAGAVTRMKYLLPRGTKVGHAGTLDPFATGVLVVLVGKATRLSDWFMTQPKQYEATIRLGATTATLDPAVAEIVTPGAVPVERAAIDAALGRFVGEIVQTPPAFSAVKIDGRRAYDLARRGRDVQMQPRTVCVYGIDVIDYRWPKLRVRIDCGKGTYIRSIARDLGDALGVGGYLTALRRTRVGPATIDEALSIKQVETDGVASHLRPSPLDLPTSRCETGTHYD